MCFFTRCFSSPTWTNEGLFLRTWYVAKQDDKIACKKWHKMKSSQSLSALRNNKIPSWNQRVPIVVTKYARFKRKNQKDRDWEHPMFTNETSTAQIKGRLIFCAILFGNKKQINWILFGEDAMNPLSGHHESSSDLTYLRSSILKLFQHHKFVTECALAPASLTSIAGSDIWHI